MILILSLLLSGTKSYLLRVLKLQHTKWRFLKCKSCSLAEHDKKQHLLIHTHTHTFICLFKPYQQTINTLAVPFWQTCCDYPLPGIVHKVSQKAHCITIIDLLGGTDRTVTWYDVRFTFADCIYIYPTHSTNEAININKSIMLNKPTCKHLLLNDETFVTKISWMYC